MVHSEYIIRVGDIKTITVKRGKEYAEDQCQHFARSSPNMEIGLYTLSSVFKTERPPPPNVIQETLEQYKQNKQKEQQQADVEEDE